VGLGVNLSGEQARCHRFRRSRGVRCWTQCDHRAPTRLGMTSEGGTRPRRRHSPAKAALR